MAQEAEQVTASPATLALSSVSRELQAVSGKQQLQLLMQYARQLPGLPEAEHTWANRVMGCTTQVCLHTVLTITTESAHIVQSQRRQIESQQAG